MRTITQQEIYDEMIRLGTDDLDTATRSVVRTQLLTLAVQAKSVSDLRAVVIKIIRELYA